MENTTPILELVQKYRAQLDEIATGVLLLKAHQGFDTLPEGADQGEMKANITLAFRHLEDARMRLGLVYKAHDGGVSNSTR